MMSDQMHYYTQLKKIKDLGQDRDGYLVWKWQRLSAIALVFLYGWFIKILHQLFSDFDATVAQVVYSPLQLTLFMLLLVLTTVHGSLGIRIICEDYIHCRWLRVTSLLLLKTINIVTVLTAVVMVVLSIAVIM